MSFKFKVTYTFHFEGSGMQLMWSCAFHLCEVGYAALTACSDSCRNKSNIIYEKKHNYYSRVYLFLSWFFHYACWFGGLVSSEIFWLRPLGLDNYDTTSPMAENKNMDHDIKMSKGLFTSNWQTITFFSVTNVLFNLPSKSAWGSRLLLSVVKQVVRTEKSELNSKKKKRLCKANPGLSQHDENLKHLDFFFFQLKNDVF